MITLNIHDKFEHGGFQFVIVDIRLEENGNGKSLILRALDPEMADKEQRKDIEKEMIVNNLTDLVNKLSKGNIGGFGLLGGGM